jgi:hypothetical protein
VQCNNVQCNNTQFQLLLLLLLLLFTGPSAVLRLQPGGKLQVKQLAASEEQQQQDDEDDCSWAKPEWGQYRQRGIVASMPIMVGRLSP